MAFGFENVHMKDSRGMHLVIRLLQCPDPCRPYSGLQLAGANEDLALIPHSADPVHTDENRESLEARLIRIGEEREEAVAFGDEDRQAKLDLEAEAIKNDIESGQSTYGRSRNLGPASPALRAANAVSKALGRLCDHLAEEGAPGLAEHLRSSIRREGNAFAYRPDPLVVHWDIESR